MRKCSRSPFWRCRGAENRPISAGKLRWTRIFHPTRGILQLRAGAFDGHIGKKVGESISPARTLHRHSAPCIEAEEIDAGNISIAHVGSHVQFREAADSRDWRNSFGTNSAHPEWSHGNVGPAIVEIEFQLLRNEFANIIRRQCPMSKKKIVPVLNHDPRLVWHGSSTVGGVVEQRMHGLKAAKSVQQDAP